MQNNMQIVGVKRQDSLQRVLTQQSIELSAVDMNRR